MFIVVVFAMAKDIRAESSMFILCIIFTLQLYCFDISVSLELFMEDLVCSS